MKLREDKTEVQMDGELVIVTRTLTEEFGAGEYIRRISQLEANKTQLEHQNKEVAAMLEKFSVKKEEAQKIADAQYEKEKAERENSN